MRLNPVKSIFLGFIVFSLIFLIFLILGKGKTIILLFLSFFLGGFIVMYFAREKNYQYILFEEILILIFFIVMSSFNLNYLMLSILAMLIFTVPGGFIGKLADKTDVKNLSLYPLISITLGLIVSLIIWIFIFNLSFLIPDSIFIPSITTVGVMGSLVIGGFIATYLAKEKKIQNGIYMGIIWVLFDLVFLLIISGPSFLSNPLITVLIGIGFIIAPTMGSYLAIRVTRHQKINISQKIYEKPHYD